MTTDVVLTPHELDAALQLAPSNQIVSAIVAVATVEELDLVAAAVQQNIDALARRGVGLVIVSDDAAVREIVLAHAGTLPFPITALDDEEQAKGWLAGQHAAGPFGVRPAGGARTGGLTAVVGDYLNDHLNPQPDQVARRLAIATRERFPDVADMNISEDQGRFMMLLVQLTRAEVVVEIGTFTGMSALWLARGLRDSGRLTCFEVWDEPLHTAREAWRDGGVLDRIDVIIGDAATNLATFDTGAPIDLAFIDADKPANSTYVDLILKRLAPEGIVLIDNTLWNGAVADPRDQEPDTNAIRALNNDLARRPDLTTTTVPIGDGLTIVQRRHTPPTIR